MSDFKTFLKNHKASDKPATHTRIGNKVDIYGGSYHIPAEDLDEFHKLYYDWVFVKGNKEYMTETQVGDPFYVDLDFRYNYEVEDKQYGINELTEIIDSYLKLIQKYMKVDDKEFYVNVFEKPHVNRLEDKSVTKDGIHLLFSLSVPRAIQQKIREDMINLCNKREILKDLKLLNDWESVFDEGLTKGTTNCQMLGSRKPGCEAYQLTLRTKFQLDTDDNNLSEEPQPIKNKMNLDLFKELITHKNQKMVVFEPSDDGKKVIEKAEIKQESKSNTNVKTSTSNLHLLKNIILEIRKFDEDFGYNYPEWSKIGWVIYNECNGREEGELMFNDLSKIFDEGKTEKKYGGLIEIKKQYYKTQHKRDKKVTMKWLTDKLKTCDPDNKIFLEIASLSTNGKIRFAENDDVASNILLEELKDHFKSYKKRLFYLDNNIWMDDIDRINDIMLQYILQSGIYSALNEKTGKPIAYAQNVSKALKIREALYSKIRVSNNDPQLYEKFHKDKDKEGNNTDYIKGRICFNDGVLDLTTKTFTLWKDIPKNTIYTTTKINYDLGSIDNIKNEKVIEEVKTKLFQPMFGDKMDIALKFLARAMGGHNTDKVWASYMGNRNCGKGVLYDILKSAFGDYVSTFELGNLTYNRKTAGMENLECSKKLYWLLDLEFVRLAISQEVPSKSSGLVVNSKMLKKITGGGDEIVARRNFDRFDTHFKSDMTPFILGNEDLVCDAKDCDETRLEFSSVVQFKTEEEIHAMKEEGRTELEMRRYYKSDPSIKSVCMSNSWKFAMVGIIMQYYTDKSVPIIREIDTEENTLLGRLNDIFEFTYKDDDDNCLLCKEVYLKIEEYDNKKITTELNAMNIFKKEIKRKESKYFRKQCFVGLKIKPPKDIPIAVAMYKNDEF